MLQVAVAGVLERDRKIIDRLDACLAQIRKQLEPIEGAGRMRFIFSPAYASSQWLEWASQFNCGIMGYGSSGDLLKEKAFDRTVIIDDAIRDTLGDALCDQADLMLAVWNEDALEQDGATWELLRMALRKRLPCIWISSKTGQVYWQESTVYDTYDPDNLKHVIKPLAEARLEPVTVERSPSVLLRTGAHLYRRFLDKYGATHKRIDAREDLLLRDDYRMGPDFSDAEACRRQLLEHYRCFDRAAIRCNDLYQATLYWRAVLPWVTSIFVAIGFYATSVFAALPFSTNWGFVAGVGFLIHGLLNLYVYMLSKSAKIKAYHEGMIRNRKVAEMLRMLIHLVPFGIVPELRRLCGEDQALYGVLRRIILEAESKAGSLRISRADYVEAFKHIDEMLSDQIAYHQISNERYSSMVTHLEKWAKIAFGIGFGFILLRAGLQFVMSLPNVALPHLTLGADKVELSRFVPSFANMLALMMPAWFSFFTNKLSLCNFRFNQDNHQKMLELLRDEQDNFQHLQQIIDIAPVEALQTISESLTELMTKRDVSVWVRQYEQTRIKHLL